MNLEPPLLHNEVNRCQTKYLVDHEEVAGIKRILNHNKSYHPSLSAEQMSNKMFG